MSKIVELNLAETKAIVGGVSLSSSVIVHKIPTGTMSNPMSQSTGQSAPPSAGQVSAPSAPIKLG